MFPVTDDDGWVPVLHSSPMIGTSVAHSARIWDYWLGGKDNYPVDRQVGDQIAQILPDIVTQARAGRLFLGRAVRYLAGEAGIGQFLAIGAGLPAVDNTHEVAQRVAPESRVVYVDNDPLVLAYARALLISTPRGAVDCLEADLRDPADILAGAARTLDLSRPVAVIIVGVLWHVLHDGQAQEIVNRLMGPAGARQPPRDHAPDAAGEWAADGHRHRILEPARHAPRHPPQPQAAHPPAQPAGPGGTGPGALHPVAARSHPLRSTRPDRLLLRPR
jgi:hypothetical protein